MIDLLIDRTRMLARGLADLALPPRCARCGSDSPRTAFPGPLCGPCRSALPVAPRASSDELSIRLDGIFAATSYEGDVEHWIRTFKYPDRQLTNSEPTARSVVAALIRDAAATAARATGTESSPGAVIPVPLHPQRLRDRGFNPAALLAREVMGVVRRTLRARQVHARSCRLETRLLERLRDTPTQTGLDRRGRIRNMAGAFRCEGRAPETVWLIDDVVTTGATLAECARMLRRAGARRVCALCVAQTPLFGRGPEVSEMPAATDQTAQRRPTEDSSGDC